jgi:hypothetical protein
VSTSAGMRRDISAIACEIVLPEVLRLADFRRVFLSQAVSTVGDFVVPIAISFAVLDLTRSVSDLGLVLFARILGEVIFFLAGGVWADRSVGSS